MIRSATRARIREREVGWMAPQRSDETAPKSAGTGKGASGSGSILRLVPYTSTPAAAEQDADQQRLAALVARMAGGDDRALADLYDATVGRVSVTRCA
jgi:hypothetical protein